ncbi:MAG TPA: AraC family transcriptional regulator [Chitinophagaceae bacterium]
MKKNIFSFFKNLLKGKKPAEDRLVGNKTVELLKYNLEELMYKKKPFLKPGYTIKDLSEELGMPSYQLSSFINHRLGMNFSDYLNQFRIKYCEEIIKREGGGKLNLQQLAARCGFQNRNTFTTAFKKFTGRTPSEYTKHFS